MWNKTQKLTRSGLLTALSCVLIFMTSFMPTMDLTVTAAAGLITSVTMIHCGASYSISLYGATSIISLIILPNKSMAVLYTVFLGCYPILKSYFERVKKRYIQWILKLINFNLVFCGLWLFAGEMLTAELPAVNGIMIIVQLVLNVVFVIYDIAVTRLISLYLRKFSKLI